MNHHGCIDTTGLTLYALQGKQARSASRAAASQRGRAAPHGQLPGSYQQGVGLSAKQQQQQQPFPDERLDMVLTASVDILLLCVQEAVEVCRPLLRQGWRVLEWLEAWSSGLLLGVRTYLIWGGVQAVLEGGGEGENLEAASEVSSPMQCKIL
jgi:hypothetical protein